MTGTIQCHSCCTGIHVSVSVIAGGGFGPSADAWILTLCAETSNLLAGLETSSKRTKTRHVGMACLAPWLYAYHNPTREMYCYSGIRAKSSAMTGPMMTQQLGLSSQQCVGQLSSQTVPCSEHEILPVESGHRVTLTYNLYKTTEKGLGGPHPPGLSTQGVQLREVLATALGSDDILPRGGFLGYPCMHTYPHTNRSAIDKVPSMLKGADAICFSVMKQLGLQPKVQAVWDISEAVYGAKYTGTYPYKVSAGVASSTSTTTEFSTYHSVLKSCSATSPAAVFKSDCMC